MSDEATENTGPATTGSATVLFLSGDLIFTSRVKAAAERAGCRFRLSGSLPEQADESVRYVVLDLSTKSSLTSRLAEQSAERFPNAAVIAYGPHVQVGKLNDARKAGIPIVLTRGQFDSRLGSLFDSSAE